MRDPATLTLEAVRVRYADRIALDRLTLTVHGGEVFGLLGPNGSGKSTTLAVAAGLLDPAEGTVAIDGVSPRADRSAFAARIGFVPQEMALYDELTVGDNLTFFGNIYGVRGRALKARIADVLDLVCLADRARHRVATLSGGMQRRANLACALIHEPAVLLLDEPTAALDAASRESLFETLRRLRDVGRAILFTTHHLDEAETWCDRVGILSRGRLVAQGRPADLMARFRPESVVVGRLREAVSEEMEQAIRENLPPDTNFELAGREFRLAAPDGEMLAYALATLHAEGAEPDSFRTPSARLESFYRDQSALPVPARAA